MKKNQTIAAAFVVMILVSITAAASAAIELSEPNPNYVTAEDAAIDGSERIVAQRADQSADAVWALRRFHDKRAQECLDVGRLIDGKITRPTPDGPQEVLAGQGGACGPADQRNLIGVFGTHDGSHERLLVSGLVEPDLKAIRVEEANGESTTLVPDPESHVVLGVFVPSIRSSAKTGEDIVEEMKRRQRSDRPGPGGMELTLVFADESELTLYSKPFKEPEPGTQAARAHAAFNSPTGK